MAKLTRPLLRQIVLAGSGLTFLSVGVGALFAPSVVAEQYGFTLPSVDAMNEFRAIYSGFWVGLAITMFTAAKRKDLPLLATLCALLILLQAVGRAVSFTFDGLPSPRFVLAFILELASGMAILFTSPPRDVAKKALS